MCAAIAGQRGLRVLLIEHFPKVGEKIRISGGGRCNFTNVQTRPESFISENPQFARSALARYTPSDFVTLLRKHRIAFHEKHKGQLFCDDSAEQIIAMLRVECDAGNVQWRIPCAVQSVQRAGDHFSLQSDAGALSAQRVVIATGGMSIPKIGASNYGYRVARQFGLRIVEPRPALVPLVFDKAVWQQFSAMAGVSLEACVRAGAGRFDEDLLFTHRGLSGPAILQISSFWNPRQPIRIDLVPMLARAELSEHLISLKRSSRQTIANALITLLPHRLAEQWLAKLGIDTNARIAAVPDAVLRGAASSLKDWQLTPTGTEGYKKAELTLGGVDTRDLSSQTMESRQPGLYFIGEVVDVTGWLGGYNFQWAWASAHACAQALVQRHQTA